MLAAVLVGCGGGGAAPRTAAPANVPAADEPRESPEEAAPVEQVQTDKERCYPYLPRADRSCPTSCTTRDECQGSRGPADLAENGWPLACQAGECVPLPPSHVHP